MNTTSATNSAGEGTQDLCSNGTDFGCGPNGGFGPERDVTEDFLEQEINYGLRLWHIIFLATGTVLSLVILLCCCIKFRIPRTKQEIEADYIRRKILRKFRSRLKAIQNQELDEMDLKCALDKIRAEFKSDTESLAQSEAGFSVGTISSSVLAGEKGHATSTYRRASQIANEISLEDLRGHSMCVAGRLSLAFSKFFGRSKVGQTSSTAQGKAGDKPKATPPPPPSLPAKSKKEAPEQKVTVVDETKTKPKKATENTSKDKEKPSKSKSKPDAKIEVEHKAEAKTKEQQKPSTKTNKPEKTESKKAKAATGASSTVTSNQPKVEEPPQKGKAPPEKQSNKDKETAKLKKELEKEKKKAKEQLEKDKKEQAKREKMTEKEKLEQAKQEKEKEKLEKQKKEREKLEKEKQEKEKKKQKVKPEKEPKKGKDGK